MLIDSPHIMQIADFII